MFGVLFQCTMDGNAVYTQLGFFFQFLWCSQTGDHPQEEIAKFGYMSERKVPTLQESSYILTTCWNPLSKCGDFRIEIPQNLAKFFSHENPFVPCHIALVSGGLERESTIDLQHVDHNCKFPFHKQTIVHPVKLVSWWILFWNVHYMNRSGFCCTFNIHVWNAQ
jgi:hypothetical protein